MMDLRYENKVAKEFLSICQNNSCAKCPLHVNKNSDCQSVFFYNQGVIDGVDEYKKSVEHNKLIVKAHCNGLRKGRSELLAEIRDAAALLGYEAIEDLLKAVEERKFGVKTV